MGKNNNEYGHDASDSISGVLAIIDKLNKHDCKPGEWPGACPLRKQCQHVRQAKCRRRYQTGLAVAALLAVFAVAGQGVAKFRLAFDMIVDGLFHFGPFG